MGGNYLQELHETCQESVRKLNTLFLLTLCSPASASFWLKPAENQRVWELPTQSTDCSLPRCGAGWRRGESRSGGSNGKTSAQYLLIIICRQEIENKSAYLEVFFLFCFAFDNGMRDNDCKENREPLHTYSVQSSAMPSRKLALI